MTVGARVIKHALPVAGQLQQNSNIPLPSATEGLFASCVKLSLSHRAAFGSDRELRVLELASLNSFLYTTHPANVSGL